MLKYNLSRLFRIRGIARPTGFFSKLGYSIGTASKYAHSRMTTLQLNAVEKICIHLHCTPNDILEWTPDKPEDDRKDHALYPLKKSDKSIQVNQLVDTLSLSQLNQLEEMIQKLKNPSE